MAHRRLAGACERHIRAGIPAQLLAEVYGRLFWLDNPGTPVRDHAEELRKLQQARIGSFRFLRDDPAAQELSLHVTPQEVHEMIWNHGTGQGTGPDPQLVFALPEPRRIYAIRLKCCLNYGNTAPTPVAFHVSWRPSASSPARNETSAWLDLDTGAEEKTLTILVNETIDRFCIHPDTKPCVFRLAEIVLAAPRTESH
jgi:hypothetical protein